MVCREGVFALRKFGHLSNSHGGCGDMIRQPRCLVFDGENDFYIA